MADSTRARSAYSRRQVVRTAIISSLAFAAASGANRHRMASASAQATPEPAAAYARPDLLVSANWLLEHRDAADLVVVGMISPGPFAKAHIPGSMQIDWPELEIVDTSPLGIDAWQSQIAAILGQAGITPESTVVAYDDGTLFAPRLWWVLHYLGHEQVHVLDGGLAAWQAAGGEVGAGNAAIKPVGIYGGTPNPAVLATYEEVLDSLDKPGISIVDARTAAEYAEGHIPGAVNVHYTENTVPESPLFWKPAPELLDLYAAVGVTPDQRVIPYCYSGVKSAVDFFTLHLLGYDDVALFTGSWNEWSTMPGAPIETGMG